MDNLTTTNNGLSQVLNHNLRGFISEDFFFPPNAEFYRFS